jgi:hypothetical protein
MHVCVRARAHTHTLFALVSLTRYSDINLSFPLHLLYSVHTYVPAYTHNIIIKNRMACYPSISLQRLKKNIKIIETSVTRPSSMTCFSIFISVLHFFSKSLTPIGHFLSYIFTEFLF